VLKVGRSKTEAGYREVDVIFAALHQDLGDHLACPTPFRGADDPLFASAIGHQLSSNSIGQRVVAKSVLLANTLLPWDRRDRTLHAAHPAAHLHQPAAGGGLRSGLRDGAGGAHGPTLTLRIYQQLLKRRRREEYRERVNELLGTSPAATGAAHVGPNSLLVPGGRGALA
jgi:hypothetical protein